MKRIKKIARLLGWILLISLAICGVGIAGGVPIPPSNKRENEIEMQIELYESEENEADLVEFNF